MKRSVTVVMVVMLSMLYSVFCQAQILGTGQLGAPRRSHTATLLQDGKILIVGGDNANGLVDQAEIFDPASLVSSNTAANPIALRTDHTATLLSDGRVLIMGGVDSNGLLASTEFYNPYGVPAPSFSAGPSLQRARSGHSATVLSDGKILIAGGEASGSAEIFDPATQSFSLATGSLNTPRQYHSAALLNSGKVLILGGVVGANTTLTSAEIYDPQTQTFTPASGAMQTPRGLALLRVLPDGKVQVIGGDAEFSMEMFDPATNSFIALAHIPPHEDYLDSIITSRTRSALITTIIQQNPVLQGQPELTAEIVALLNRLDHTVTEIPQSNRALIAGGVNDAGQILGSATVVSSSAATITTDKFDYAPGETVTITGSGFQSNETVWMLFHEEPETHTDVVISSVADSQGNFTNTDYAPALNDLNRNFTLTAIGQISGFTAQTAFKDAGSITSINPTSGPTTGGTPFTIVGTGFSNGQEPYTVTFGTTSVPTTRNGTTQLTGTTPAHVAGAVNVTVTDKNSTVGTFTNGFTYIKVTPTITWNNPADITYGTALSATQLNATASVPGTFTYTPASGTVLNAGNTQNLHVDFTPTDTGTYNTASKDVKINVNKAATTTTISCPASVTYTGSALTPCTATATGAGGLSVSVTVVYGNNTNAGTATADATYAGDANHNGSTATQKTFTIDKATSTTTISCPASVTYTGSALTPCTATATGAGGLSASVTVVYGNNTNVGTATADATYAGDANHTGSTATQKTFTIDKASSTTTVTCPANVTYTGSALTPCSATVTGAGGLSLTPTPTYTNNTNVGTASASYTYAGDANHNGSSDSKNFTIDKASSATTVTFEAAPYTYRGTAFTATAAVTGAGGLSAAVTPVVYTGDCTNVTVANGCTATATFAGDTNHLGSSDSKSITITKASSTTVLTFEAGPYTYRGTAFTATAAVTGAGGLSAAVTPVVYTGDCLNVTSANGCTATATYAGDTNHLGSSDSKSITITKASSTTVLTFEAGPYTYRGTAFTATAAVTGAGGLSAVVTPVVYTGDCTNVTVANGCTAMATFAGDANHLGSSDSKSITITKASSTTTLSFEAGPYTYRGTAFTATANVTGVGGLNQAVAVVYSGDCLNVTVANGCTATATFAGDTNHLSSNDSKSITINKATPTVTATALDATFTGNPYTGASGSATGVQNESLTPVLIQYAGSGATVYPPSTTPPTNAGTYTVRVSFAGNANYTAGGANAAFTINKASSTTIVTFEVGPYTYRGSAFTATANVTGVGGLNQPVAVVYSGDCTNVTVANGCTATATFAGDTNHLSSNDSKSITIEKAISTTVVTFESGPYTYRASAFTATANVTGVGGLNQPVAVVYSGDCLNVTVANGCTATATFAGDTNHTGSNDSKSITITKASSTTVVTFESGPYTYRASAFTATANVTGVGGLNAPVAVVYSGDCTNVTVANGCTATATFAGDTNHTGSNDNKSITIEKAISTTTVTFEAGPYTYRGTAFTASANVTGAGGLSAAVTPVVYTGDCTNVTSANGCTATATFTGDANHLGSSDGKSITITQASSTTTVTASDATYDGNSHGGTAVVTGVGGLNQAVPVKYVGRNTTIYPASNTAPTAAGDYIAQARYPGDANHTTSNDAKDFSINLAPSITTVSCPASVIYNGAAQTPCSATVTGAGSLSLTPTPIYANNINVGTATASYSYAGDANHTGSSDSKNFAIDQAPSITAVTVSDAVYDGNPHGGTAVVTGVGGLNQAVPVKYVGRNTTIYPASNTAPTAAGDYIAQARYPGDANHTTSNDAKNFSITLAPSITTVSCPASVIYNGAAQMPCSATVTGAGSLSLTPTPIYADNINVGTATASYTYGGDANHSGSSDSKNFAINQASQMITVDTPPPANAYFGNSFTVTAWASSGLAVSIGSSGSCSGSGSGSALITINAGSGNCTITFNQPGDSNYLAAPQVSYNVIALNTAPVAQAQTLATSEDMPLEVTLSASDIDNGSLTFSIVNPPAHGSLGIIGSPSCIANGIGASCTAIVTYSPAPDFNGSDSFSFKVNDGSADSNIAAVSITVNPVNDMPTANAQPVVTNDATPVAIALAGSDMETTLAANLTFSISMPPAHGVLSGTLPNVIYTPFTNYKGPDFFKFTVTDRGDPDGCTIAPCSTALTSPEATVSITVTDGTAPTALITALRPLTLSNDRDPKFGFTGTDNVTATDDLIFECKMDGGEFSPCGNPMDFTTQYFTLGDGAHTFQVRAKDQSDVTFGGGNTSAPDSHSWTIDATPPDTMINSGPSSLSITNTATATFTFESTENNSTYVCRIDLAAPVACSSPTTYNGLSDGQHTFTVTAKDQAGNNDPTPAIVTWTIDTLAPDTTINSGPANPTTSTSATFVFSSPSSPGDSYECSLDVIPASFTPCSSPVSYNGLAMGSHTFQVRGKDMAGNMETSPAVYNWTIGAVTVENYTMDSDFKRFDGFDVVFGKGSGSYSKINSTNPDSFHYQIRLTNNTATPIGAGNMATAIITVPGMPAYCGGVPCSGQIGALGDPAFLVKGRKVAHVWPGHHERDDDDDDDDMPVTVKYMSLAQYQANGYSCADSANAPYSSTLPANGAAKCIKITGFSIPVRHAARIRVNFQFRLKGTDGWHASSQQLFYAGFVFRATTSVHFGAIVQTATDATGLVGAGKKATAIGGYAFNNLGAALSSYAVRVFTKAANASCTDNSKLIAQDMVDSNGFYYIWRSGLSQANTNAPSLPSGVQYAVQLCDSSNNQRGLKSIDSKLRDKEFEQVDFDLP